MLCNRRRTLVVRVCYSTSDCLPQVILPRNDIKLVELLAAIEKVTSGPPIPEFTFRNNYFFLDLAPDSNMSNATNFTILRYHRKVSRLYAVDFVAVRIITCLVYNLSMNGFVLESLVEWLAVGCFLSVGAMSVLQWNIAMNLQKRESAGYILRCSRSFKIIWRALPRSQYILRLHWNKFETNVLPHVEVPSAYNKMSLHLKFCDDPKHEQTKRESLDFRF